MTARRSLIRHGCAVAAVALLTATGGALVAGTPAMAAGSTRYVATSGDDTENDCTDLNNPCLTIEYAVSQANSGDTISIGSGTYAESVHIRESLTLVGAGTSGTGATSITGDTESGDPSVWLDGIDVNTPPQVTVRDINVSGNEDNDGVFVQGGSSVDQPVTMTVVDSVVSNNDSDGVNVAGQAIATITGSTLSGNGNEGVVATAVDSGQPTVTMSGDYLSGNADGGAVNEGASSFSITTSTLDRNVGAGVVADAGDVTVTSSTVSNTAPFGGQEATPFGGGVLVFEGNSAVIQSSTIVGNTGQGVLSLGGDVQIANSTIAGTLASAAGEQGLPQAGVAVAAAATPLIASRARARFAAEHGQLAKLAATKDPAALTSAPVSPSTTMTATISADNNTLPACAGTIVDGGYNLADDNGCAFTAKGSTNNGDAQLGALADNGGPTETLLPAGKTSDAVDAIPAGNAACASPSTDQRGVSRPQGPRCDIGAVEVAQSPIVISPLALPSGRVGNHYRVKFTATGGLGAPYLWSLAATSGRLPPGLHLGPHGVLSGTPTKPGRYSIIVSVDDPVTENFTIVIKKARTVTSLPSPVPPPAVEALANTGADTAPLVLSGLSTIGAGVLLMWAGGARRRRYVRAH